MLRYALICALLCSCAGLAAADSPPPFGAASYPLPTSPAADEGALGGTFNPAAWGRTSKPALDFFWNDRSVKNGLDNWGIAVGQRMGFSARRTDFMGPSGPANVVDYQVGVGSEKNGKLAGVAYGWSGGDTQLLDRQSYLSLGTILQPSPRLFTGITWRKAIGTSARDWLGSIALSPSGNGTVVLFGDYALEHRQVWNEGTLQGGIAIRPKPSFEGVFRMRESGEFQVSIGLASAHATVRAANDYQNGDRLRSDYLVRVRTK